ncbi:hypothetical protein, partial [Aeromonas rivipollensis]|uniref:hypothetical protein n=1 Tax=Aeromonas rivipollensis TaxID=948519 RepID=UPI003CFD80E4
CQPTIAVSKEPDFHFTIPVVVPPSGALVQIGPLSADNRCLPWAGFHFTIPVTVPACGHSGADHPVVSRQLLRCAEIDI